MKLEDLDILVFDCEVFAHDWLFVFKAPNKDPTHFWNDATGIEEFMEAHSDSVFCGFNNKRYDAHILKAILNGCTPEEVKEVNDFIISGAGMGWEHPYLQGFWYDLNQTDLMDDTMLGTSLKSIEGHLGMSVEESTVDFEIERELTEGEREEVLKYCLHDVEATTEFMWIRRDYLETKMHLASLASLDPIWALSQTDPMLAAAFMHAEKGAALSDDERDYEFPDRLDYDYVPDEVVEFFERIHDMSIPDEELFKMKLETEIGGCPVTYAWGGVHGALPCYKEESREGRMLLNYDVASLYPSLMIEYGYVSRAVPDPQIFANIRSERFEAKRNGDKQTANALKSPLNKAYGAMLNKYNPMYDPKMARSVCISGQLSMTVLACAYAKIPGLRIIQINTDGIMVSVPDEQYGKVISTNAWWQSMTKLELEEDKIRFIWQKDVSNYALMKTDGSQKVKGAYLVRGISAVGAWSINNNATIVADALREYLLNGTPIAETVNACDDPSKFQIVAKASGKYSRVYQEVFRHGKDGSLVTTEQRDSQRCNRVFASSDERFGRLFKVKRGNGAVAKIESLPDHCLISNEGMCDIDLIDKSFYVALGEKRASDFKRTEKKVATTTKKPMDYSSMNVYQKLAIARKMFLDANVVKSGWNDHMGFEYFELEDITPPQTEIFAEVGLIELFTYVEPTIKQQVLEDGTILDVEVTSPLGVSVVVNTDKPEEQIVFRNKWTEIPTIKSSSGKKVTNELQSQGSVQTYLRRYNKMQVLDIVERDTTDNDDNSAKDEKESTPEEKAPATKRATKTATKTSTRAKKPATQSERKHTAKELTDVEGTADAVQIRQLKKAMKQLKDKFGEEHTEVSEWVANVALETNKLTEITREQAEKLLLEAGELHEKFSEEEE